MALLRSTHIAGLLAALAATAAAAQQSPPAPAAGLRPVLEQFCFDCHDSHLKKGGLDLTTASFDLKDSKTFDLWVKVHDRVRDGEMPPKKKPRPGEEEKTAFLKTLAAPLVDADHARTATEGRSVWRRMNRYEYENTLRDLLSAPWLQIRTMLPEDGELHRFNKVGEALDISHVQMARYLSAAEYALRQVTATGHEPRATTVVRYYAREQPGFARRVKFNVFNRSPERTTFPIIGNAADVPVLEDKAPMTVGKDDPEKRELESMGVVASTYEPLEIKFDGFEAPAAGRYKLRICAHSFWAGPQDKKTWWRPNRADVSAGRTHEPVTIYAETPPRLLRKLGGFDVTPEASVQELDVYLLAGETIRPDAVRLFRSRPPGGWHNPLAQKDGQPGVTFRWLEVEGPILDQWPSAGHKLLFGNLPVRESGDSRKSVVVSQDAKADARRLLENFLKRACRNPAGPEDADRFLGVIHKALDAGIPFSDAMIAGYSAVLCSPAFVTMAERPGPLSDHALASRLSYFLWNSEPDAALRQAAERGELQSPQALRTQTDRLLADPRSQRFIEAFLDYWLDLRRVEATSPDASLYPDYYLDDFLVESSVEETRQFFTELLRHDLPSRNLIDSDFVMVNERLAAHYGLPQVHGSALRRVALPAESPRGGLLTQASILKVTANGTTTSPVMRGAWITERILGTPPPRPPPNIPAVEPDTRGAVTIREQLEKHRTLETCNACHAKIDPTGFALENFDILGGWRSHYRATGTDQPEAGFGKNGQPFAFHAAQPVDASGEMPDGRQFSHIEDLKRLLLSDERQIARNLAGQFTVYGTGAPVGFSDRIEIEALLDRAASSHFGVRSLIHELVQSKLFRHK